MVLVVQSEVEMDNQNNSYSYQEHIEKIVSTAVLAFSTRLQTSDTIMSKSYKKLALSQVKKSASHFYQTKALNKIMNATDKNKGKRLNHADIQTKINKFSKNNPSITYPVKDTILFRQILAINQYHVYREEFTSKSRSKTRKDHSIAKHLIYKFYKCLHKLGLSNSEAINLTTSFKEFLSSEQLVFNFENKGHEYERTRTYLKNLKLFCKASCPVYIHDTFFDAFNENLKPKRT